MSDKLRVVLTLSLLELTLLFLANIGKVVILLMDLDFVLEIISVKSKDLKSCWTRLFQSSPTSQTIQCSLTIAQLFYRII